MNPIKISSAKNQKAGDSTQNKGFCDLNNKVGSSASSNHMESCILCLRKVFQWNLDSSSCDDGLRDTRVLQAEVTYRFYKTFNRVCRLVNETDAANESGKSGIVETKNGSLSKLPTLCQECADKIQTVDTLTNLLKVHVSEIRTLFAKSQIMKNCEVVRSQVTTDKETPGGSIGQEINFRKEKIKYERETLLQLGNKKVDYFNVLERGLPDLLPQNAHCTIFGLNEVEPVGKLVTKHQQPMMKTIDEKPKTINNNTTALTVFDSTSSKVRPEASIFNSDVDKVDAPNSRIQYDRDTLIEIGNGTNVPFFDTLGHGCPDLMTTYLSRTQPLIKSKIFGNPFQKPAIISLNTLPAPVTPVNNPVILEDKVANLPISVNANHNQTDLPLVTLVELLADPKLSPKTFNNVALHVMDIPATYTHSAIQMLLVKAIDMPELSNKVSTLLHFVLEKCEPNNQDKYQKFMSNHCKMEIQTKFSENPQVIKIREQLRTEADDNVCDDLQLELERLKYKFKRRSLNVIKLMGLLYKEKLIGAEVVVETINKFVVSPEEDKLELVCLLYTLIGEYLEGDCTLKAKWFKSQLNYLRERANSKKISGKVRDLILNLWRVYKNKWKWEGLSETDNATAMVFQKYSASAIKSFEATINSPLFNFYFPGTEVGVFIENLCKQIANKPNIGKVEDAGKLIRLLIANRNITKLETLFEISSALKYIGQDVVDFSKTANQMALLVVEIFSEENNLDWLLTCGKYISQESPPFWKQLVTESFEMLYLHSNEHLVRMALNKTTGKAELAKLFEAWEEKKIRIFSKQIQDSLRPKIDKGAAFSELQRVLQKNSWDLTQIIIGRALLEAICSLSWNASTNNWNDQKFNYLIQLFKQPNDKMLPHIWNQTKIFCEHVDIGTEKHTLMQSVASFINVKLRPTTAPT